MEELLESKSITIAKNIEKWKQSLLDLSKRNQLVNFKYNKKRVLKINNDIFELYNKIIDDEKIKNIEKLDLDFDLEDPLQLKEFQAITKKLRKERNTAMNEKGINVLYLTFGMLAWKEYDNAQEKIHAPLLLLPVELHQGNRNTPMQLHLFEEQLVVNPSLQFKFKNEFGITLPEFDEVENLEGYIDYTKDLIKNLPGSELLASSFLALLQFSKIALYKDMEQYKDLIETHPIVGNIASEQQVYNDSVREHLKDIDPEVSATESFQVLDADSSQIEAIIAAKNGYSYVLQGPPGTGKSQTIANIIAECLSQGQKVLFVSEKIAALNVVYKRLSQVGLGNYCLELHSNKSNKKNVITNLYDTYIGTPHKSNYDHNLLNTVEQIKYKINSYVKALHKVNGNYNQNAYIMHGYLSSLSNVPTTAFTLPSTMPENKFNEITALLEQLSIEEDAIANFKNSIWNDIQETSWSLAKETQLKENLSKYLDVIQTSNLTTKQLLNDYNLVITNLNQLLGLLHIHEKFNQHKALLVHDWLLSQLFNEQLQLIEQYQEIYKEQETVKLQLLESFTSLNIPKINIKFDGNALFTNFSQHFIDQNSLKIIHAISEIQDLIQVNLTSNILSPIITESIPDNFKNFKDIQPFFELMQTGTKIPSKWIDDEDFFEKISLNVSNDHLVAINFKAIQNNLTSILYLDKIDIHIFNNVDTLNNIDPGLKEPYKYCYENSSSIIEHMTNCIQYLEKLIEGFSLLRSKFSITRDITLDNIENLLKIVDIIPEILYHDADWLEGIGIKSIERSNAEFFELKDKINNHKLKVLEHWHEDIIDEFEKDPEIYNRFHDQYNSIFKVMSGKYRSDMKRLTPLLLENTKPSYEMIKTKLKFVERYYKLLNTFKGNERIYEENMGVLYDGLNTEKLDIQKNMQALRNFKEQCELYSLTSSQMNQILSLKKWLMIEFHDRKNEIKIAIEYLKNNYPQLHTQLRGNFNLEVHTFEQLKEGLSSKLKITKELVQKIETIKSIIKVEQEFTSFTQTLNEIDSYQKALNSFQSNFNEFEQKYKHLFIGLETNWDEITRLISWWKSVKIHLSNNLILKENKDSVRDFVKNFNNETVEVLNLALQRQLSGFTELSNKISSVVPLDFLEQLNNESFHTVNDSLSTLKIQLTNIHSFLERVQNIRKENWHSKVHIAEDLKNIHKYETLLIEMEKYNVDTQSILNLPFEITNTGFENIKNQIILNKSFIIELKNLDLPYDKLLLSWMNDVSIENIESIKLIDKKTKLLEQYFKPLLKNFDTHSRIHLAQHIELIESKTKSIHEVEKIVRIKAIFERLIDLDLTDMIEKILNNENLWNVSPKKLFLKRYYENALDEIYAQTPELANFNKDNFEQIIKYFKMADQQQFGENAIRLNKILRGSLEENLTNSILRLQLSTLSRENEKKKRHMPLRRLFNTIPELLLSLKPCILMSPLSVCEFLDPRKIQFDLVIFDEASQICPEDAIAPMIRGRNVIMAGDSKQMPPTSFFKATASTEEDYDDDEFSDDEEYESVLGLCSDLLPQKTLKWHYRSKHESLIAFSNKHFYNNALNTFPSAINSAENLGVKFEFVENGYFDRSGSKTNPIEAERVAQLIIEHYQNTNDSLGVIAFSQSQMEAIEKKLEVLLKENPELENVVYNESVEEPFFIKNLENVQGDERDVILLSVGYAKDQNGVFYHQFGPLNKAGGERRLNVAITRSKKKLVVISSMKDSEINLSNTQSTGAKLLKNYLEYARTGQMPESVYVNSELEFDSPLEKDIYESIVSLGYDVKTQIGTSGYRIDLGVIHPEKTGTFLVGIECDGASYHSSKTARDRDRLRQQVLEGLGWKIYRIWSQDWFKNKSREIEKIKAMLEELIKN